MFSYSKAMRKKIKDPINHMTILFFSIGSIRVLNFHAKFRMYYQCMHSDQLRCIHQRSC